MLEITVAPPCLDVLRVKALAPVTRTLLYCRPRAQHSNARVYYICVNGQEAKGRNLRQGMEFAEREAAVAARAEKMALRLGNCGPEELATLATKKVEWEVISR